MDKNQRSARGGSQSEVDYFKIVPTTSGYLSVVFSDSSTSGSSEYDHYIGIEDSAGNNVYLHYFSSSLNVATGVVGGATYYVKVYSANSTLFDPDSYTLTATHTSGSHNYETEGNNSRAAANALTSGTAITGSLVGGSSTEVDYYSITASGNGLLSVSFSDTDTSGADGYDHYMALQDASGNDLALNYYSTTGTLATGVTSGTYYVKIYSVNSSIGDGGLYSVTATYTSGSHNYETEVMIVLLTQTV